MRGGWVREGGCGAGRVTIWRSVIDVCGLFGAGPGVEGGVGDIFGG